jgi:hypothetical protein
MEVTKNLCNSNKRLPDTYVEPHLCVLEENVIGMVIYPFLRCGAWQTENLFFPISNPPVEQLNLEKSVYFYRFENEVIKRKISAVD